MWLYKKRSEATKSTEMPQQSHKVAGLLVHQGDSLHIRCSDADEMCRRAQSRRNAEQPGKLSDVKNSVWSYQTHHNAVVGEHGIPLPFVDRRS